MHPMSANCSFRAQPIRQARLTPVSTHWILNTMNTLILLDLALIDGAHIASRYSESALPSWIAPVYNEDAYSVTPLLIDVDGARDAGEAESMIALVNARKPQLHASFIDTEFELAELTRHFRQFICIKTEAGDELTLRFADCAVLPVLASYLNSSQWATLTAPMGRWLVHGRDGRLKELSVARPGQQPASTPLVLTDEQIARIKDAMGTDRLLANLRNLRPAEPLGRSSEEAYRWASEARAMWSAAGRADDALLLVLARGIFQTNGRILNLPSLRQMLTNPDPASLRKDLRQLVEMNSYESHK
jgi:hypothetical protein